ncbi:methyltransferase domain-containing protein [Dolichospermum circinale CS-541/06]|nr:methyltransferase domain-containing protein [Dolichospermum circinale]MDB9454529.1 methyltransferase domain-containing protein [Dolichospermum circinale CS-541/06]MDB9461074.1 methyltransferase domain-containing protein [Dolichospermum circinale CS-541/04]MDB9547310.1 methyltransferase domain-containing protein [Dolichospermum circinale CS-1031]
MIENNNPEINVDELMEKIRQEILSRQGYASGASINNNNIDTSDFTSNIGSRIGYIESLLKNAESRAYIRTKWPEKLNRFPFNLISKLQTLILKGINFLFKDQREVNFNLILSLKESLMINHQLTAEINTLKSQIDDCLITGHTNFQGINERLNILDNSIQKLDNQITAVDTRFQGVKDHLNIVDSSIQELEQQITAVDTRFQGVKDHLNIVDQGVKDHFNIVDNSIQELEQQITAVDTRFQGMNERHFRNDSYLKNDLMQQKRLISLFLEEARQRLPEPFNQEQLQTFVSEDQYLLNAFYLAFEDHFRGTREDIFNRLKVYLPLIEKANVGTPDTPILDVGCGRGEWLELLRESGYTARGLDINRVMIEQCQARGLEVIAGDVIDYLASLPDNSLGAVTGFHIIEHLPFKMLMRLFSETVRVIKPQGLVIFETPNPDNVLVGSNTFYLDPTHINPLPSPTIKFMAETCGLYNTQIITLHPYPENAKINGQGVAERFNDLFYGPQDYAVVGYKHE